MTSHAPHAVVRIALVLSLLGGAAACNGVASPTPDEDATPVDPDAATPQPEGTEGNDTRAADAEDATQETNTEDGAAAEGQDTTEGTVVGPAEGDPVWADVLSIEDRRYLPETLLAGADRELVIVNEDDEAHTVTAFDGNFDATLQPGERVEIQTPPEPGAYRFSCRFHPEMRGMLDVM